MNIEGSSAPALPQPDPRIIQMLSEPATRASIRFLGTLYVSRKVRNSVKISEYAHRLLESIGSRKCQEVMPALHRILALGTYIRPSGSYTHTGSLSFSEEQRLRVHAADSCLHLGNVHFQTSSNSGS